MVVRVKTSNGTIELVNLPKDAAVFIDGEEVSVTWPGGGKPAVISVTAGKHKVSVKKDGLEVSGDEVAVRAGGKEVFTMRMVPLVASPSVKDKADDRPAGYEEEGEIPWHGLPDLPLEAADKRGATGSAVEGPALVPAVKRGTPPATPRKPAEKRSLSPPRLSYVNEFNKRQTGLLKQLGMPHNPNHGESDGVFFVYGADGQWFAYDIHGIPSDGTCEVVARVLRQDPRTTGEWLVIVHSNVGRGFLIKINTKAQLFLEPDPFPRAKAFRRIDPRMGPIMHPAIRPGGEFNRLLLLMRHRELMIFVNGAQVCTPVRFDYDITPAGLELGVAGLGKKRAEFDRVEIRELMRPEDIPAKAEAIPKVTPAVVKPADPRNVRPTVPDNPRKLITNSIGMKLVLIPAGEFMMGSPDSDHDAFFLEKPQHRVRITRPFYMGVCEVTQVQYKAATGETPSHFKGSGDLPVEMVSWNDALAFCDKLSAREGLKPYDWSPAEKPSGGDGYRLPTEAEWEYACRAGHTTRYSFGDDAVDLGEYTWNGDNSQSKTHGAGQKHPNAFGLYDMNGNVWEWCLDNYDAEYYRRLGPLTPDPNGPSSATGTLSQTFVRRDGLRWFLEPGDRSSAIGRVIRGGGWENSARSYRSAHCVRRVPGYRSRGLGFRVVRVPAAP